MAIAGFVIILLVCAVIMAWKRDEWWGGWESGRGLATQAEKRAYEKKKRISEARSTHARRDDGSAELGDGSMAQVLFLYVGQDFLLGQSDIPPIVGIWRREDRIGQPVDSWPTTDPSSLDAALEQFAKLEHSSVDAAQRLRVSPPWKERWDSDRFFKS